MTDSLATEFVSRLHFDVCFITGAGLTAEFGLSNGTDETASFQRADIPYSSLVTILSRGVGGASFDLMMQKCRKLNIDPASLSEFSGEE